MTEDMEMSCDEAVMKKLGDRGKADYGECLLSFSVEKRKTAGNTGFWRIFSGQKDKERSPLSEKETLGGHRGSGDLYCSSSRFSGPMD